LTAPSATVLEIAKKQRHLHLLSRVKENKHLTVSETKELAEYEDMTGTKKPTEKKKNRRPKITAARLKLLAVECETIAAAEEQLAGNKSLAEIFDISEKLKAAWERGRFLRNLRRLAATAATITEAAQSLGMEADKLGEVLNSDIEAADMWNQARLAVTIDIKTALVAAAKEGKAAAIKNIEMILQREIAHGRTDFSRLSIDEMCQVTGRTRQTLHEWYTNQGLSRNSDKTFDLKTFLFWFENYVLRKADHRGSKTLAETDPLKAAKTEKLEINLAKEKKNLLDREQVMAGVLARYQMMINSFNRKADELAMLCHGQPPAKITELLNNFFTEVLGAQCQVPEELALPPAAAEEFLKLLAGLREEK